MSERTGIRVSEDLMRLMGKEQKWPEEWTDVPAWQRFYCGLCGFPIRAFLGCGQCSPMPAGVDVVSIPTWDKQWP